MDTGVVRLRASDLTPEDARLRARIRRALQAHGQLDATKVGIVLRNGEVLLWGSVASANERALAAEIAAAVAPSAAVSNGIRVFRSSQC